MVDGMIVNYRRFLEKMMFEMGFKRLKLGVGWAFWGKRMLKIRL